MKKTYFYSVCVKHKNTFNILNDLLKNRNILELTSFLFLIALILVSLISSVIYFFKVLYEIIHITHFMYYGWMKKSLSEMKEYVESHDNEHLTEDVIFFDFRKKICAKMVKFLKSEGINVDNPFDKFA